MTPDILRAIGEAAYGERWQTPLAKAVGINDRRLRYWLAGRIPIPARIEGALAAVLADRRDRVDRALTLLSSAGP